jgi:hypothetical protein
MLERNKRDLAVSAAIGSLLVFTILIFSYTQYVSGPAQKNIRESEQEHREKVRLDMIGVKSAITQSISSNEAVESRLSTGIDYGFIGFNPAPNTGVIVADDKQANITIRNAESKKTASGYLDGFREPKYQTDFLEYSISYNRIARDTSISYEHGVLYSEFRREDGDNYRIISETQIIEGNRIKLYTIKSNLDISASSTLRMRVEPISAPSNTVSVQERDGTNMKIVVPTQLPVEVWRNDILSDELSESNTDDKHVVKVEEKPNNHITITMEAETQYALSMGKAKVSTTFTKTQTEDTETQYISNGQLTEVTIRPQETSVFTAQARDKYHNPVPNVELYAEASTSSNECLGDFNIIAGDSTNCQNTESYSQPGRAFTGVDGVARFVYQAPEIKDRSKRIDILVEPSS